MKDSAKKDSLRSQLLARTAVRSDLSYPERDAEGKALLRCVACGHRCRIYDGRDGICKVRSNVGGQLRVPWNYVGGVQVDPIEKKPFFHVYPGAAALSFGMLGCDLRCGYCQNWFTSQALRDPNSQPLPTECSAEEIVGWAERAGARVVTSTYNEPLITSEWAVEIFKLAHARGLKTSYVSNGNATPEVLDFIRPHVDFYKIDLKSFDDKRYRQLGAVLSNVTDSIERVYRMGFWLEIVTLLVPGFNDEPGEIKAMAQFLASVSRDIPWHVTAFHDDYKMSDQGRTPAATLLRAAEIGREAGLNFVYAGNLPGQTLNWENTYCPHCHELLIERRGFRVGENRLRDGHCPACRKLVPGVWG